MIRVRPTAAAASRGAARVHALVLAASVLLAPAARAQEASPVPLTAADAIERALAHSHRLAEARAREAAARAAIDARRAAERPMLSVSGGYTRTNHVDEFGVPHPDGRLRVIYPDIPDNYYTRASFQWPIYTGGRTDALIRAAEAESGAAAADIEVARADLRLEVTRAYWAVVTARESVRVVAEALQRAEAHLRDVRSRFDNGLIPPNEVSAVEAQRARQEVQLIEARNIHAIAIDDLRRLTGIDADIVVVEPLTGADARGSRVQGSTVQGSMGQAVSRAELTALDLRIAAADERAGAILAGRKPSVAFTTAADYANPNPRIFPRAGEWRTSWELGVNVSWTLWDGGRIQAEAAEAAAAGRALRARHAELSSVIATDVRQRERDLDSARAALTAVDAGVAAATESRRVVSERFNVGVATSTEVLDAHVVLLQAELDRTRALANIRLAEARLARALGQ
jgi:outer membrane protein